MKKREIDGIFKCNISDYVVLYDDDGVFERVSRHIGEELVERPVSNWSCILPYRRANPCEGVVDWSACTLDARRHSVKERKIGKPL